VTESWHVRELDVHLPERKGGPLDTGGAEEARERERERERERACARARERES
jgi:hypothetical protein